jgi:hypothetical protein
VNAADFVLTPAVVDPSGNFATFTLTFKPKATGQRIAKITIPSAYGAPVGALVGNDGGGTAPSFPDELYLGNFTILVPAGSGPTTFTLGAADLVIGGNTVTHRHVYDLDLGGDADGNPSSLFIPVGNTVTTFTVALSSAAAPEPGALGVFACCGGLLAVRRRRSITSTSNATEPSRES